MAALEREKGGQIRSGRYLSKGAEGIFFMAATCALTAPPDLFHVCNKGTWVRGRTRIRFLFAGRVVAAVDFQALLLDAPFTHVKDDGELPPPPERLPPGIE